MASSELPVLEFILTNFKNFNARQVRDAVLAYWKHIRGGGRMFWAIAGAMSSAQLGITLAPAIRAGLVHGMSVTGANLEESLFRLVAHHSYKDFPDYRYLTKRDDTKILESRMRRVTDTSIPEDEAFRTVEKIIVPMWKAASERGQRRFWHEYFYDLIQAVPKEAQEGAPEHSWLLAAARANLPVVVPGHEDSTFGNIFAQGVDREVGHRNHGRLLRPIPGAVSRLGSRLLSDRRRHRRRLPHLRGAVDQVRPPGAGEAVGVLLPDQRLDDVLRQLLGRDPK
jgi:deoxyhypusine synthase